MNNTCKQCGAECCKTLLLGYDEKSIDLLTMRGGKITPSGVIVPCKCLHLTSENKCAIYDNRPEVCRTYPVNGISCLRTRAAMGKE